MIRKIGAVAGAAVLFFLACLFFVRDARALDGVSVQAGRGDDRTYLLRVAVTDQWRERGPAPSGWTLAGYWEFAAGLWDNTNESTAELAATPVFRFERQAIYVEGAIGFHLVSTRISSARVFSTAFQFGDHLGAGMRFGPGRRYDLGMRIQHLSNGGVRSPNPGINFLLVRLQYDLE
jgi:lipid A 3-O-deacylase